MTMLTVNNVSKKHGDDFFLNDVSFSQTAGHKIAIAGETGSGKSTLARIIAGLGQADNGTVFFEGKQVKGIEEKLMPGHKGIAYLSQHFELPNKYRVEELLAYANDLTEERNEELYRLCDVQHLLHRWTHTLSGGEKQRVALTRLLTTMPRLLVLDEPYSNMDQIHRSQLKKVIADVEEQLGVTCTLISHDAEDMLPWAKEILVMRQGIIVQRGTPHEIYMQPNSAYVAGLFGKYVSVSQAVAATLDINVDKETFLRPEDLIFSTEGAQAIVQKINYFGSHFEAEVNIANEMITINAGQAELKVGNTVYVKVSEALRGISRERLF